MLGVMEDLWTSRSDGGAVAARKSRKEISSGVLLFCGDAWIPKEMYMRMLKEEREMYGEDDERGEEVGRVTGRDLGIIYWAQAECGKYGQYGGDYVFEEVEEESEEGDFVGFI